MHTFRLDASNWKSILDFYYELLPALGAPIWHGWGINALIDSMIYGDINKIVPPYAVQIVNTKSLPKDLVDEIRFVIYALNSAGATQEGISLEIPDWPTALTAHEFEEMDARQRRGKSHPALEAMDHRINQTCIKAAEDLDIEVIAPFRIIDTSGNRHWYEAYIANFGRPKGTVVGNMGRSINDIRAEQGYYSSCLSESYAQYNRQLFIDTLNDWGWYGEKGKEPKWYKGEPWTK